jgi:hypothetical protein
VARGSGHGRARASAYRPIFAELRVCDQIVMKEAIWTLRRRSAIHRVNEA